MDISSETPTKPRFLRGALYGGCVAGLISAIGMAVLMLNTQAAILSMTVGQTASASMFAPSNLILMLVFFISAFPVWFLAYATLGRAMLSYSISSGRFTVAAWTFAIALLGVAIAVALNLSSPYQTMFSGPFLPTSLILSATLGFVVFWKKADSTELQLKTKLQRQGLISENNGPAEWAVAAARRIADKKD